MHTAWPLTPHTNTKLIEKHLQTCSDAQAECMQTPTKQPKPLCCSLISVFQKQTQQSNDNCERMAMIRQENCSELSGPVLCQDGNI